MKEQVSQEEAKEYAESIGAYFRLVSAKDGLEFLILFMIYYI